jgi:glycogen synthase
MFLCSVFFLQSLQVSHTYSREVAGHGAIAPHRGKFHGILNGIDPDIWDPYTDNCIPVLSFKVQTDTKANESFLLNSVFPTTSGPLYF